MLKFAEFFAGIGLVRLGLEPSGWVCKFANDIDPNKQTTYEKNFGDKDFVLGDVWKLDETKSLDSLDLYTASFPCVDLSLAGNRKGINGEESGTFWAFLKHVEARHSRGKQPKIIMLENVAGFLSSHGGEDIYNCLKSLNQFGYHTDVFLLDAKHFTPQSRPRVFVIGCLSRIAKKVMTKGDETKICSEWEQRLHDPAEVRPHKIVKLIQGHPDIKWGLLDIPTPPSRSSGLSQIIERMSPDDSRWWTGKQEKKVLKQIKRSHMEVLESSKDSNKYFYGTLYRRVRNGTTFAELRYDGIAGCLRTPRGGSSKQIIVRSGKGENRFRWMTPREYGRLQGVPDDFWTPENNNKAYFGYGDAVCVPAISWIEKNILRKLVNS